MMAKKKILHKFKMDEISGVDRMAQAGAKLVLMKRDDLEIAKGAFKEALFVMETEDALNEAYWAMWESDEVMRQAICNIVDNPTKYPDTQAAIIEAIGEYSERVQQQADGLAVGDNGDGSESSSGDPTNKSDHSNTDNTSSQKENTMDKKEPTVETLTADVTALTEKLAKSDAFGKLSDPEKAHYATLDDNGQADFLKMDEGARANVLEKVAADDPVIYTTDSGEEFKKSDDARLVAMAKQGDEDRKLAKAEREKRVSLELTKRAEDELSHLPGEAPAKVALLKAIDGITDESHRTAIGEMLKAADDTASPAFDTRGTTDIAKGDAEEKLDVMAKAHAKEHSVPFAKAYDEVLKTDEGQRLYDESQS